MKLCIVTHSVISGDGQGRVNYEIAQEALRRGHSLIILASHIAPELEYSASVKWISITVNRFSNALFRNLVFSHQSARWLQRHRNEYDMVLSNGAITSAPSDLNMAHFVHSTWLTSPHHTIRYRRDFYGLYQWLYTALNAYWEKQAFKRTKTVVAVSNQVKAELVHLGLPAEKVQVILNGVDLDEFQAADVDRATQGLPEDVPLGLFVGDIRTPRKNLETVLKALVQLPELHLAIAGDAKGSPYPAMAADLGIQTRTHFLGYRRDISTLMQAVDLFIFPSRYETFGLVVLEAMASGLPVVTSSSVGASELIMPGAGTVLPDCEDVDALSAALADLAISKKHCADVGYRARTIAMGQSWINVAAQYLDYLETQILNKEGTQYVECI